MIPPVPNPVRTLAAIMIHFWFDKNKGSNAYNSWPMESFYKKPGLTLPAAARTKPKIVGCLTDIFFSFQKPKMGLAMEQPKLQAAITQPRKSTVAEGSNWNGCFMRSERMTHATKIRPHWHIIQRNLNSYDELHKNANVDGFPWCLLACPYTFRPVITVKWSRKTLTLSLWWPGSLLWLSLMQELLSEMKIDYKAPDL